MQDIDYSGVDPIRLTEAKRRVAVLEEYTQKLNPTRADTEEFANRLNLSRVQFNRLVRTWRDHRNPSLLVIGKLGTTSRNYGIAKRAVEIAYKCIATAGADDTVDEIYAQTVRQCVDENLRAPSRGTIWNYLRKARTIAAASADVGPPRIAIERIWARLPIIDMPTTYMPTVLIAVLLPERLIVAHDISIDRETPPSVSNVITELARARSKGSEQRPLLLAAADRRVAVEALEKADLSTVRSHDRSILREMSKAFAGQLGPLELIHRRGMAKSAKRLGITRQETPFTRQQAIELIKAAIKIHNNGCKDQTVTFDIKPE